MMKRTQYQTDINAPVAKVFDRMLGRETFKIWAAEFNPTSDFEGEWKKGSKILFTGVNSQGKREGMLGYIREFEPEKFVSIEYLGLLDGDKEITDEEVMKDWHGFENYTYEAHGESTKVLVDIDVNEEMTEYFNKTYPKALLRLKELCEKP
jgi:uncharacterized protein YndB with AHSA1/START domain